MNDTTQNPQTTPAANLPKLDDLKKSYISPAEMADRGQKETEAAIAIATAHGLPVVFSFDAEKPLPAGFGVSLTPVVKQAEKKGEKSRKIALVVGASPDVSLLLAAGDDGKPLHDGGLRFISKLCEARFHARFSAAYKAAIEEGEEPMFPANVEEFIAGRESESLAAWRELSDKAVKGLRKKKFSTMTKPILKTILASAAVAKQLHATVPQETWDNFLDLLIGAAKAKGLQPGALQVWRDTRHTVTEVQTPGDFDVDSLADLLSEGDDDGEGDNA